jgi:hypothetical protein
MVAYERFFCGSVVTYCAGQANILAAPAAYAFLRILFDAAARARSQGMGWAHLSARRLSACLADNCNETVCNAACCPDANAAFLKRMASLVH